MSGQQPVSGGGAEESKLQERSAPRRAQTGNMTSPTEGSRYRRYRPRLVLGYQQDRQSLIEVLTAMRAAEAILDSAIEQLDERQSELQTLGLSAMTLPPTVRYGAMLRVLRDLSARARRFAGTTRASSSTTSDWRSSRHQRCR